MKLAGALAFLAAVTACQSDPQADQKTDNQVADNRKLPALPIAEPPIDRARLLIAVARAASAHATGTDDLAAQRKLDGRQFEVRLRFGCDGQGPGRGDHGWSIDPDGRTLRLRAVPTLSLDDVPLAAVAGGRLEAAEGFWLPRPWLLTAACPAHLPEPETGPSATGDGAERPGQEAAAAARTEEVAVQRIGIARFFTREDSRTGRRIDRPFQAVVQLKEGERAGQGGFNLVLSGRLSGLGGGRVIHCTGDGQDRPPDCIVAADVDRVWIERPEDKAILAEWTI